MNHSFRVATSTIMALSGAACLTSCATMNTHISPEFAALQQKVETDPAPDAIVGMWHREARPGLSGSQVSLLFRRGGNGMMTQNLVEPDWGFRQVEPIRFTYSYQGNGVWIDSYAQKYRLADGALLREAVQIPINQEQAVEANIKDVFQRVE